MLDKSITLMCKSWLWMYTSVFKNELWRNWRGVEKFPFYCPIFCVNSSAIPAHILEVNETKQDFFSCCEHWYECCLENKFFEVKSKLPNSGGGLGLVASSDVFYAEIKNHVIGVLEFVNKDLFDFLKNNNYPSLYQTQEQDYCIVIGPLSLCNNGRTVHNNVRYPQFKDRDLLMDLELLYSGFRKDYKNEFQIPFQSSRYIEFEHFALAMHVTNNILLRKGDQIMVDYGFVTKEVIDLTV
jgi:hypothetical protein